MTPTLQEGGFPRVCVCGRLLCVQAGSHFHVKHRDTRFVAHGSLRITCGRCRRATTLVATRDLK